MAIQDIDVGALPNDGTGDSIRTSFQKVNANFDEVANASGIAYDNSTSGLTATNLQDAIDELAALLTP